jgi:hypothetical protein
MDHEGSTRHVDRVVAQPVAGFGPNGPAFVAVRQVITETGALSGKLRRSSVAGPVCVKARQRIRLLYRSVTSGTR